MKEAIRAAAAAKTEKEGRNCSDADIVRPILRRKLLKGKRPKPAPESAPDLEEIQVTKRIGELWDEEMPKVVPRMTRKSAKRDASIMKQWAKVPDFEAWRFAFRALALSSWHIENVKKLSVYILRDAHFIEWVEAGDALRRVGDEPKTRRVEEEWLGIRGKVCGTEAASK